MALIKISELRPHPRNEEFFDSISGTKWEEFLKSVKECGIIEPVIITPDKVIVSGHHRVKACKELGIDEIEYIVRIYDDEDDVVRDLIETNIRQRGDVGGSTMKMAARIKEIERIYGIKQGGNHGNQYKSLASSDNQNLAKSQSDLAKDLGISIDTWNRYKRLADAIPELAAAVDGGKVTKTTAIAMMRKLSQDEQKELLEEFDTSEKITSSDVENYIAQLEESRKRVSELEEQLENRPIEIVEVEPDDYEEVKQALELSREEVEEANARAEESDKNYLKLYKDFKALDDELKRRDGTKEQIEKAERDFQYFVAATNDYLRRYGGHIWAFNEFHNMPDYEKKDIIKAVKALDAFAQQLIHNLGGDVV